MTIFTFTIVVGCGAFAAGLLGSLTGMGGGVVIVPLLVLVMGVDMRYAIGASLVSVIATSSGAAATYVREGFSNIRIGMFLEVATTLGAFAGASLAAVAPVSIVASVFGVVLLLSAHWSSRPRPELPPVGPPDPLATWLRLNGTMPTPEGLRSYHVRGVPLGFGLMFVAGILSGLLGIGSGVLKVLAMDQVMQIPFKVSTTTSNFMIGVTAATSAGIYLSRGYIDPGLTMPVTLGVLAGSALGSHLLTRLHPSFLRRIFGLVIVALALQMIYKGLTGGL